VRKNRASSTAKIVALWRALADGGATSVPGFRDPFAADMLTGLFRVALALLRARLGRMSAAARTRAVRRYDTVPIRVAVIDRELGEAVRAGCRQVVILGAGFDTRAYRLDELAGVTLFEVDHPATQTEKRERVAAALPPAKAKLVWAAVDFERDSLAERLDACGHDAAAPTAWIWEGVVMYLADDAVRATLDTVRARSAPGSVLVLHYHEPSPAVLARQLRRLILSGLGEPQIGSRPRAAMRALVEGAGFVIEADLGIVEQAAKVGAVAPDNNLAHISRILVARAGSG
jgi:methyltransferase (TIGR00027 family)